MLPEPSFAFTVPSVHDDTVLACRIYLPVCLGGRSSSGNKAMRRRADSTRNSSMSGTAATAAQGTASWVKRGVILAHPYAPLGGCFDNPVVHSLAREILDAGWIVGTFNFRGAAPSKGRTSWTGKAELNDYISFAGFFIHFLHFLNTTQDHESLSSPDSPSQPTGSPITPTKYPSQQSSGSCTAPPTALILGGYSYGSLILTNLPPIPSILSRFTNPPAGSAAAEVLLRAGAIATQANHDIHAFLHRNRSRRGACSARLTTVGGEETSPEKRRRSREMRPNMEGLRKSFELPRRIISLRGVGRKGGNGAHNDDDEEEEHGSSIPLPDTSFLLVSPLIPPTSMFLTMFSRGGRMDAEVEARLTKSRTLAVFGDRDAFTSVKKLRPWAEALNTKSGGLFESREISGAGHFWMERGSDESLKEAVRAWVRRLGRSDGAEEGR
ncbi:Alpha/Beta hydrolase protein [Lineolata rhizophorae]|uniref:Alpha/Beta hydrolase protein n=1 Tax=Lineolata rhizophorae TaxID=578093 RepID=A0A6A6NQA1_9PEZI|nr:Alpha/Beta hydrolase protein [Lineolata rhizophorae]